VALVNRKTKSLRQELWSGPSLKLCRDALEAAGHEWRRRRTRALIFVLPNQCRRVVRGLRDAEVKNLLKWNRVPFFPCLRQDRGQQDCD
jgi:hypothetical protein